MASDQPASYAGPDRRQPVTTADTTPHLARTVLVGAAVVLLWFLLVVLARHHAPSVRFALVAFAHATSAALLLAAAALRFAAWRITGTARDGWSVIALGVAGPAIPVITMIGTLSQHHAAQANAAVIARGLVVLALICFGAVALLSPTVVSRLRPLRIAAPFLAGCLVIAGIAVARGPTAPAPALDEAARPLQWTIAVLFLALAAAYVLIGRRRHRRSEVLFGAALTVPAAGSLVRAALGPMPYQRMLLPAGVELFVACLVAGMTAAALWRLETGRGTRLLAVTGELRGARTDLDTVEYDQARRLHDARNAILAVSGAVRILARRQHHEAADDIEPEHLEHLVTAELDRLGALLDPDRRAADRPFRLPPVLEPLILAHRMAGGSITATVDRADEMVIGRPDALATAVANVLTNARVHAPGAHVWVSTHGTSHGIEIRIADDGPGIPASEQSQVVRPGIRGSQADRPGSGIGLAAAAQAMSEQGGTLRVTDRPTGGTMIMLTLRRDQRQPPAIPLPPPSAIPEQRRHHDVPTPPRRDDVHRHPARIEGGELVRLGTER